MAGNVDIKVNVTEGKNVMNKIIIGKSFTNEEWEQKEKEKWKEASK